MKFARPINTGGNPASINQSWSASAHPGIDYGYPEGTPVYASADGEVILAKANETRRWIANSPTDPYRPASGTRALTTNDYGNYLKIRHASGYETLCAHMKYMSLTVKVGDKVKKGQKIGEVGSTGNSTGNHVHWEVWLNGVRINPSTVFDSGFTNYQDKQPAGQVAVDADVFPKLIHASNQWDRTCEKYLPGKDPKSTPFEDLDRVIAGIKSHSTSLEKQLATSGTELKNREEQVSRLKDQLLSEEKLRRDLETSLNKALKNSGEVASVYEGQLAQKQSQINDQAKAIGDRNHKIADLEVQLKQAKEKGTINLSIYDVLVLLASKIVPFLKSSRL